MSCLDSKGGFGTTIEAIEHRKKRALEDVAEMEKQIEELKARQKHQRDVKIASLHFAVMDMIEDAKTEMTELYLEDPREMEHGEMGVVTPYNKSIGIELAGRYKDTDNHVYFTSKIEDLQFRSFDADPTLAITYLVPLSMIDDSSFFQ